MSSTRKLPVRIDEKKRTTSRSDYLLPQLAGTPRTGFTSIKTARTVDRGCIVFLGREVSPETLLEKFCENNPEPPDCQEALRRLSAFVEALQQFRIGNVLSVEYSAEALPRLRIEQEHFLGTAQTKLP
jgi:hypothetical protein